MEDKDKLKEIIYEYESLREFIISKATELSDNAKKTLDGELKNSRKSQSG